MLPRWYRRVSRWVAVLAGLEVALIASPWVVENHSWPMLTEVYFRMAKKVLPFRPPVDAFNWPLRPVKRTQVAWCKGVSIGASPAVEMLNPSVLHGAPEQSKEAWAIPCIWNHQILLPNVSPIFSVLLNSFNSELQIRIVLVQLLKLTRGPWELIILDDGSSDRTVDAIRATISKFESWSSCAYPISTVNDHAQFNDARLGEPSQGDIGNECLFLSNQLVRIVVAALPEGGVLETAADNIKMRMAHPSTTFFILIQDDQIMTLPEWNMKLSEPARRWGDVFSTSARCAHDWPLEASLVGPKCLGPRREQSRTNLFHVRDSGNRGPLLIRANAALHLGLFDETRFSKSGEDSDHELNHRASQRLGMVSGFYPVPYTEAYFRRRPPIPVASNRSTFYFQRASRLAGNTGTVSLAKDHSDFAETTHRRWEIWNLPT